MDAQRQQLQPQQESAVAAAAAYDTSQLHQSYDPSKPYDQSYYYNYQQQPPHQYDASNYHNYYHQYTHPETSAATAPSEQQPNEASGSASLGIGQVQDPYGDPSNQVDVSGTQPNSGYPLPAGLNPTAAAAAVAALSQLTQFVGTMDAAMPGGGCYDPGHFHPPGGGRQGAGPSRGGSHGFRRPFTGRSGSPAYGRGCGGGRGRGGRHGPPSAAKESTAPVRCEVCQVDCTSKEILEQHNNGKRHQKNLQKLQLMKGSHQPVVQTEEEKPGASIGLGPEMHENILGNEPDKQPEVADDNNNNNNNNNRVQTLENDNQVKKTWMKRKMRGGVHSGRGGKRVRPAGLQKPKVAIPLMCDLCNVKCDTQEVFDRHAAGKKHMAKLKRFEGHQAMYGPTAVQALYPPNPLSQTLGPQPAYFGAPNSYVAPPEGYVTTHQALNPNPQLADAPLEFGTQSVVSRSQATQGSTGETLAGNGVQN